MTRRRALIISVFMGLGVGILVLAALLPSENPGDVSVSSNPAVSELLPDRGDTVLPQANVGAILAPGWAGEIIHIGGTAIPVDQQRIEKARNSVIFRPDEGLASSASRPRMCAPLCATGRSATPNAPQISTGASGSTADQIASGSAGEFAAGQQTVESSLVEDGHSEFLGPG